MSVFKKFGPRPKFWAPGHPWDPSIRRNMSISNFILQKVTHLWQAAVAGSLFRPLQNQSQKIFLSKNSKISAGQPCKVGHTLSKLLPKLSSFWPFWPRCAQTDGSRGYHRWLSEVPLGGYQMTPQTHWSGLLQGICGHKTIPIVENAKIENPELFIQAPFFRQKGP